MKKRIIIILGSVFFGILFSKCYEDGIDETGTVPGILVDWESFGVLNSEEIGLKLIEVIPQPCSIDRSKDTITSDFNSASIKDFNYSISDNKLYIDFSVLASCTSNFVASIYTEHDDSYFLIAELFEYGYINERCECCFNIRFVIKIKKKVNIYKYDIWPSLNGESIIRMKKQIKNSITQK